MGDLSIKPSSFFHALTVAFLSCCAALVLSSCSEKPGAAIIGKWQLQGQKDTFEFRKDGTVITFHDITAGAPDNTNSIEEEMTEKYAFTDGNHMSLQINTGNSNQPTVSVSCEVLIHGDMMEMTITAPGESRQHKLNFKRLE